MVMNDEMTSDAYPNTSEDQVKENLADDTEFDTGKMVPLLKPIGSSGTRIFGGYFSEEYLQRLRGKLGAFVYDEMRRSEPQVAMLLDATMNPIKAGNWEIDAADQQNPDYELHANFVRNCLFEQIDFDAFKHEALTMIPFGNAIFEVVHSVVENHPEFGTFNGLKSLALRSQKTIERWNLEPNSGKILSVDQYVYSDVGKNANLPGVFILVITLKKEGDNYEGISFLRPMYGPYIRKHLYHKLIAIGAEKYAVGTPIGTIPKGKEKDEQVELFKKTLQNYTSHEAAYITVPEGWAITIQKGDFDAEKMVALIQLENTEMINAAVANFLALGMSGNSGAFALGTDLSDFFLLGIQSFADVICGVINRQLIPSLIKMNFGPQQKYPKLKCTGINDKAGKDFATVVQLLTQSNAIRPDMKLEEYLRKRYKMPLADPSTTRQALASPMPPAGSAPAKPEVPTVPKPEIPAIPAVPKTAQLSEMRIQLAESFKKKFNVQKEAVKGLMQDSLTQIKDGLIKQIKSKWKGATPAQKIKLATTISAKGVAQYKSDLKDHLAKVAYTAIQDAAKEVPNSKRVALSEFLKNAPRGGYFDKLPPKVKASVQAQSSLIGDTQAADLEKVTAFQYSSSSTGTENVDQITFDIDEALTPVIAGSTAMGMNVDAAAANAVANIVNQARMEWFFQPEVLDSIESFTFTNEAPVTDICTELSSADATWATGDPRIDEYTPPLHYNCKSRLVPNLVGDDSNPDITGTPKLTKDALDSINLSEAHAKPNYHLFTEETLFAAMRRK